MAIVRKCRLAQSRFHDSRPFFPKPTKQQILQRLLSFYRDSKWETMMMMTSTMVNVSQKMEFRVTRWCWILLWSCAPHSFEGRYCWLTWAPGHESRDSASITISVINVHPSLSLSPASPSILIDIKLLARIYLRHEQRVCSQSQSLSLARMINSKSFFSFNFSPHLLSLHTIMLPLPWDSTFVRDEFSISTISTFCP